MTTQSDLRSMYDILEEIIQDEPKPLAFTDEEIRALMAEKTGKPVSSNRVWYWRRDLGIANCKARKREYTNGRRKIPQTVV